MKKIIWKSQHNRIRLTAEKIVRPFKVAIEIADTLINDYQKNGGSNVETKSGKGKA